MRIAYAGLSLKNVEYPSQLLEASGAVQPGTEPSVYQALEAAVAIAETASKISKLDQNQNPLLNGPFGAVRLVAKRKELYRYLQLLQSSQLAPEIVASELLAITGTVAGLGWNCVNNAHLDNGTCSPDPTAHAEMQAIRAASLALDIPMGQWRGKNLCCIEVASAQNCDMCRATNDLWAGTALSIYAAPREDICNLGFNESSEQGSVEDSGIEWGHTAWDQCNTKCTQVWAGLCDQAISDKAQQALQAFQDIGGTPYQPNHFRA